ncbi:metal ABC transporter permease [Candidatus Similichlamydia laticola]|uniref:Manganese ABC transporter, inner membrane permease protein SitD n=1 Tax=Candidatus Similichlamydia laticola TaxID=2170265 RepID=A0A369KE02_9BACT|nr:metal ABC transporter permease [Candidatus Similichlamydia laticola]RDB31832.1 Manganese ABC transporter, inner membrane permease protein SitD [Candidatus Similichlamydia laticola]
MVASLPYCQADFFDFFSILLGRLLSGAFFQDMAADEMQMVCLASLGCLSAYVGSLLYLSRMTMLANTVSHTSLVGIVIGTLVTAPSRLEEWHHPVSSQAILIGACVSAGLTAALTHVFRNRLKIREDASLALVFSILFALGVAGVSLFWGNSHVGLDLVMGNLELVTFPDVALLSGVAGINVLICLLLRRGFIAFIFDQELLSCWFRYSSLFEALLLFQVALIVTASLRVMGLFLPLAYLVGIPMWSRSVSNCVADMWKNGALLSVFLSVLSVALARACLTSFDLALSSSGVSIVCLLSVHLLSWPVFRAS